MSQSEIKFEFTNYHVEKFNGPFRLIVCLPVNSTCEFACFFVFNLRLQTPRRQKPFDLVDKPRRFKGLGLPGRAKVIPKDDSI